MMQNLSFIRHLFARLLRLSPAWMLLCCQYAGAVTYSNTPQTFAWIDASSHARLGYNTTPYKFNGSSGCGTTPPTLDDTLSDPLPIGFSFMYSGVAFSTLRVMTNGRVQFNNNTTCGYGSPVQTLPYPNSTLNYTMRIYGNDLDPTLRSEVPGGYNTPCVSRASCYVSYATIGTAPYRSFVVTWNNVPEWTSANTAPIGSYSLQLILQENGEFVFQYGDDIPGPSAKLGQVGWQADSTDYDTPQVGFPANNTAIKFYIPRPVVEYRMEQPSWNNTDGQVLDTSGNGGNGTVLGNAQTIAAGRVCRAASIPLNTTSRIDGIDTGLSVPDVMGNSGTITFWYKSNTAWSGSGARDAQLLDASAGNGRYFYLVRRSTGSLKFVITDSGGVTRSVESPAIAQAAGTWKHIAVSWSFNPLVASNSDHLRIYIDGVQQPESAFTTSSVISSGIGTLMIGDNGSGLVGPNGTLNSTDGAIDEFRAYNAEGAALVTRDMNLSQAGCLSHYAVSHSGNGLTCQQSTITVTAHDLNHGNIVMPNNTTQIRLSTDKGTGDWTLVAGYGVLDNGAANDGIATYLFNGEYQAIFALTTPAAANVSIGVTDGQFTESATEDPTLVVKACVAALFNACEPSLLARCTPSSASLNYARLNTKLADTAFTLDLVKLKSDATLESTFGGTTTVDLIANTNAGATLASNNCPTTQTAAIPLGTATFMLGRSAVIASAAAISAATPKYSAYRDVRVRVTCSASVCGGKTDTVACSTDNFAVRPQRFTLSSSMSNTALSGTPLLAAGKPFTLSATAVAGYDGKPLLDNTLAGQQITTHLGATDFTDDLTLPGSDSPFALGAAAISNGVASNGSVIYSDVGTVAIGAGALVDTTFTSVDQSPTDALTGCIIGSSSNTAVNGKFGCNIATQAELKVGRFVPDHFDVSGSLAGACGSASAATDFTYMSQNGLRVALGATALGAGNQLLTRYTTNYPRLASIALGASNTVAGATTDLATTRLAPLPAFAWLAGSAGRAYRTDTVTYPVGATALTLIGGGASLAGATIQLAGDNNQYTVQSGPTAGGVITLAAPGLRQSIPNVSAAVTVVHSFARLPDAAGQPSRDGPYDNFSLGLTIIDPDGARVTSVNGVPQTAATSGKVGNAKLRFGRMRINTVYGADTLPLTVPVAAQYWDGAAYVTNVLDNCTLLLRSNFQMSTYLKLLDAQMPAATTVPLDSGLLVQGLGKVVLAKPVAPLTEKGSFLLQSLLPYLPGSARETIGVYRTGPVIYLREVY